MAWISRWHSHWCLHDLTCVLLWSSMRCSGAVSVSLQISWFYSFTITSTDSKRILKWTKILWSFRVMLPPADMGRLIRRCLQCWMRPGYVTEWSACTARCTCSVLGVILIYPALHWWSFLGPNSALYNIIITVCRFFCFKACEIRWAPSNFYSVKWRVCVGGKGGQQEQVLRALKVLG